MHLSALRKHPLLTGKLTLPPTIWPDSCLTLTPAATAKCGHFHFLLPLCWHTAYPLGSARGGKAWGSSACDSPSPQCSLVACLPTHLNGIQPEYRPFSQFTHQCLTLLFPLTLAIRHFVQRGSTNFRPSPLVGDSSHRKGIHSSLATQQRTVACQNHSRRVPSVGLVWFSRCGAPPTCQEEQQLRSGQ